LSRIDTVLIQARIQLSHSDSPRLDAELLLCQVLKVSRSYLFAHAHDELNLAQVQDFENLLARRIAGEPIAYLLGKREFWSFTLKITPDVLIPRPDTELLVEQSLARLPEQARVLELGTGSGAIAIALAVERPHCVVLATDISQAALNLAQENAQRLTLNEARIQFMRSAWFAEIPAQQFDLIVSNPPYIAADDPHLTQGDVRFEPYGALVAEAQGFNDLREIIETGFHYLVTGGWVLLEHGYTQGAAVRGLFHAAHYQQIETYQDLAGLDRVTVGRKLA